MRKIRKVSNFTYFITHHGSLLRFTSYITLKCERYFSYVTSHSKQVDLLLHRCLEKSSNSYGSPMLVDLSKSKWAFSISIQHNWYACKHLTKTGGLVIWGASLFRGCRFKLHPNDGTCFKLKILRRSSKAGIDSCIVFYLIKYDPRFLLLQP